MVSEAPRNPETLSGEKIPSIFPLFKGGQGDFLSL
jgi:hypothetical protein